jgi:hypothetical protein
MSVRLGMVDLARETGGAAGDSALGPVGDEG